MTGKVVSCHEGEPHQIATGTPLDTSHSCPYKSLADILLPCLVSPEHTLRAYVCWSCTVCHQTYRGSTTTCTKDLCKGKSRELSSYHGVARRFVAVVSAKASLSAPMWTRKGSEYPDVLSPTKLCEVLLTPHGNRLSGMQDGAWTLLEDEGKCSCHVNLPPPSPLPSSSSTTDPSPAPSPAVLPPPELLSTCSTSPMEIEDEENNSAPVFASEDIREKVKLGIKPTPTLKQKKKWKKAVKAKSSSKPPTEPSPKSNPAPPTIPPPPPTSKPALPPTNLAFPPTFNPAVPPPFLRRSHGLLPTPNFAPNIHANDHVTPYDPAVATLGDKEPGSEPKGNPQSWGLWWCWISDCGRVNQLPQDWCGHCGHSKHMKQGNVLLNNLKRKLSEISGGAD